MSTHTNVGGSGAVTPQQTDEFSAWARRTIHSLVRERGQSASAVIASSGVTRATADRWMQGKFSRPPYAISVINFCEKLQVDSTEPLEILGYDPAEYQSRDDVETESGETDPLRESLRELTEAVDAGRITGTRRVEAMALISMLVERIEADTHSGDA